MDLERMKITNFKRGENIVIFFFANKVGNIKKYKKETSFHKNITWITCE